MCRVSPACHHPLLDWFPGNEAEIWTKEVFMLPETIHKEPLFLQVYLLLQEIRVHDSQLFPEPAAADPPTEPTDALRGKTKDLNDPEDNREAKTQKAQEGGTVPESTAEADADAKVYLQNNFILCSYHRLHAKTCHQLYFT